MSGLAGLQSALAEQFDRLLNDPDGRDVDTEVEDFMRVVRALLAETPVARHDLEVGEAGASEVEALARVLATPNERGTVYISNRAIRETVAHHVLAAGYRSPESVAALVAQARAEGAENDDQQPKPSAVTEAMVEARQVWCVAYDNPIPSMDGAPPPIRMAEQDREMAERNYAFLQRQERTSPKRDLRIETRFVTEWTRVTPFGGDDDA